MSKKKTVKEPKVIDETPTEVIETEEVTPKKKIKKEPVMVKIFMKKSIGKYQYHIRYKVDQAELDKLPPDSYVIIN
jgi:hypothetical protein